jgi:hypothetical protein
LELRRCPLVIFSIILITGGFREGIM